jgi:hypothetical protein
MDYSISGNTYVIRPATPTMSTVNSLAVSGTKCYIGGTGLVDGFYEVASWDTSTNTLAGLGTSDEPGTGVYAIAIQNGILYAGGDFDFIWRCVLAGGSYTHVGSSLGNIYTLIFDNYHHLIIGGNFTSGGGVDGADYIVRYSTDSGEFAGLGESNGGFSSNGGGSGIFSLLYISTTEDLYAGGNTEQYGDLCAVSVYVTLLPNALDLLQQQANNRWHPAVTIGTPANGLSITDNQELSIALASTSTTGALSDTDWDTFNDKLDTSDLPLSAANGGTGIANGASASLTLPNLAITLGGGGAGETYTLPAAGGTLVLLSPVINNGDVIIANNKSYMSRNAADSGNIRLFQLDASNNLGIGAAATIFDTTFSCASSFRVSIGGTERVRFTTVNVVPRAAMDLGSASYIWGTYYGRNILLAGNADVNQLKVTGFTTQTLPVGYLIDNTAATNVVRDVLQLETQSTGTAAAGLGAGLLFSIETATAGTVQSAAQIAASWIDATNVSRKAKLSLSAYDTAARLGLEIEADGSAAKIGLYGVATVTRATTGIAEAAFTENVGGTAVNVDSTFGGYTLQQMAQALQDIGILT